MRVDVMLMLIVGVSMWIITPLAWLYIGSMVKLVTNSLNTAVAVMFVGAIVTIVVLVKTLGYLDDDYHRRYDALNDEPMEVSPLEPMLVFSAVIAITVFGIWLFLFSGASLAPTITNGT